MPNQHTKQAITVRVDPALLAAVRERLAESGDTITELVCEALTDYVRTRDAVGDE